MTDTPTPGANEMNNAELSFFAFDSDNGITFYHSADEARKRAANSIQQNQDSAADGYGFGEVDDICWGEVRGISALKWERQRAEVTIDENGIDEHGCSWNEDWAFMAEYELKGLARPEPESPVNTSLANFLAQCPPNERLTLHYGTAGDQIEANFTAGDLRALIDPSPPTGGQFDLSADPSDFDLSFPPEQRAGDLLERATEFDEDGFLTDEIKEIGNRLRDKYLDEQVNVKRPLVAHLSNAFCHGFAAGLRQSRAQLSAQSEQIELLFEMVGNAEIRGRGWKIVPSREHKGEFELWTGYASSTVEGWWTSYFPSPLDAYRAYLGTVHPASAAPASLVGREDENGD